jgi:hypothetical protein
MSTYLVKPTFNRLTQTMAYPAENLNFFMRSELHDNFNFYQSQFGVYSWMQLNDLRKYTLHTMSGTPFMWQQHKSCGWDPTGSIRVGRKEFEPSNAKINEEWCYDELFDSCYKHFLQWNGTGPIRLNNAGVDMVNKLTQTLGENATLGAMTTLTVGQLYDPTAVTFKDKTSENIRGLFTKTVGTCRGWVELLRELGLEAEYRHLDVPGLFDAATDFSGEQYIGDPIALFDNLRDSAPTDLQSLMNEGGIVGSINGDFMPLFLVSGSVYNAIAQQYRTQMTLNPSLNISNPRLTRERFPVTTGRGTSRNVSVYYIDDVPVVPVSAINQYDKYLTGTTHFAGITVSGNISLGGSFGSIPDLETNGVGILVQRETNVKDLGKYYFAAHALFSAVIADYDYIVATQIFV